MKMYVSGTSKCSKLAPPVTRLSSCSLNSNSPSFLLAVKGSRVVGDFRCISHGFLLGSIGPQAETYSKVRKRRRGV